MSDTPGREPEQRLPVPRPPVEVAPVERFSGPPSTRAVELTPERAAQVVRSSSNARWVGFLAVVVVVLFITIYWFYELAPLGLTQSRLDAEADSQQVTSVERGYNLYEANCARCHGANGEGGIGPVLNRQEKLFAHLSVDYLNNMMIVGGRYACGNPNSLMPVWSNEGHPPGPLNYIQIEDLIAFIRAPSTETFTKRDPALNEPMTDPLTGEVETFNGWLDPSYKPPPGATPFPACWSDAFATPSGSPAPAASVDAERAAGQGRGLRRRVHDRRPSPHRPTRRSSSTSTTRTRGRRTTSRSRTRAVPSSSREPPSPASQPSPTRCRPSPPGRIRSSAPFTRP